MLSVKSTKSWLVSMLAFAVSALMLTGCSIAPTKQLSQLPPMVKPSIEKPLTEMQPMQAPAAPGTLSTLPPAQQANTLFRLYIGMSNYAGQCTKSRDALIDWINRQ